MNSLLTALVLIILVGLVVIVAAGCSMGKSADGSRPQRVGDGLKALQAKMEKYALMTQEILSETPDENLLEGVLANLWNKMRSDLSDAPEVLSSLSLGRNYIYAIYAVTGGLKTGNVRDFLKKADASFLPVAVEALKTMDAQDAALRLEEIIRGECTSTAPYVESFEALDVKSRMVSYIRSHSQEFID